MYYNKYLKYKNKYIKLKKINNIIGGMSLDIYITNYFKTYNFISWKVGEHIYKTPENNKELNDFCNAQEKLTDCNPPYELTQIKKTIDDCCKFKGIGISKRTIYKFAINTPLVKDNIEFKLIKTFDKITTPNYRQSIINYQKKIILEKIKNIDDKTYVHVINIIKDEDDSLEDDEITVDFIIYKITNNELYCVLELFNLLYQEYVNDEYYNFLINAKNNNIGINSIQEYENKLFLEYHENKKTYYFYFSFGTIKFINQMLWHDALLPYITTIRELLIDDTVESIILAGHSVGNIVIQYLGIELLLNNVDVNKIYIIGSACPIHKVLDDSELLLFKEGFKDRYFFVITGYIENEIIYYDSKDEENVINKINTNILVCKSEEFNKIDAMCNSVSLDIVNSYELLDNIKSVNNIKLHDFNTYSNFYLQRINL
jgi:hypothetical protein